MKVGGKAKLVCPASIAYGDNGRPPTIPGGSTLVFEVELLETKAAPAAAAPGLPPGARPGAQPPANNPSQK
jgi:FKBP-type peptidyl-prolyl cis-trans isomerase FkpA